MFKGVGLHKDKLNVTSHLRSVIFRYVTNIGLKNRDRLEDYQDRFLEQK